MSDAAAGATEESSPSKLDPEKLSLRAQPAPAVRFKRGMVIGLAAKASIGVFGVAWMALQPGTSQIVGRADEDAAVLSKAPADALSPPPSSYEQVPQLVRPPQGDLGRPILRRQQPRVFAAVAATPRSG